jgi:glycosyltransferase involved in cell wall biosynthesis
MSAELNLATRHSRRILRPDLAQVSILVPARNEAATIAAVLQSIPPELVPSVLVVDGRSTDRTPDIARALGFRVMTQRGAGLGDAIATGVEETHGDVIVTMDADGAHDGGHIVALLDKLADGYDLVLASRMPDAPESVGMFNRQLQATEPRGFVRDFGNRFATALCRRLFGLTVRDVLNGCRAFRREVFAVCQPTRAGQAHDIELLLKAHNAGFRITEVPIDQSPRLGGSSKLSVTLDGAAILSVVVVEYVRSCFVRRPRRRMSETPKNG